MNTRSRGVRRWPCELDDATIEQIKAYADDHKTSRLEMTRRLILHGINCPFFSPDVSSGRIVQPNEPTA